MKAGAPTTLVISIAVTWCTVTVLGDNGRPRTGYHPLPHGRDIAVPATIPHPFPSPAPQSHSPSHNDISQYVVTSSLEGPYSADVPRIHSSAPTFQHRPSRPAGLPHTSPQPYRVHAAVPGPRPSYSEQPRGAAGSYQPAGARLSPGPHQRPHPTSARQVVRPVAPLRKPFVSDYSHETHRPIVLQPKRPADIHHAREQQQDYEKEQPAVERPYNYDYTVSDHYSGANFAKQEDSDGKQTVGSYSVSLPDGRIQHVKYVADKYSGFNAVVTYEGEAHYPEQPQEKPQQKPQQLQAKPEYKFGNTPGYSPTEGRSHGGSQRKPLPYTGQVNPQDYGPPRGGGYHLQPLKRQEHKQYRAGDVNPRLRSIKPHYKHPNYQLPPVY